MALKLHEKAFAHARQMIQNGLEVETKDCDWNAHKATADEVNKFIETHTIQEYGQWFLGIDDSVEEAESIAHYQLPFGDLKIVHKGALVEAQKKAAQQGAHDIAKAAQTLLQMISQIKR